MRELERTQRLLFFLSIYIDELRQMLERIEGAVHDTHTS